jgi:hypothetical protein
MRQQYSGPGLMKAHFYLCPQELAKSLPEYNAAQGIQCTCGQKDLSISKRMEHPTVFAHCKTCGSDFKVYENGDYPAGYITDDPTKPLKPILCDCGGQVFRVAVGYEYPGDETSDADITWFTMVGECLDCGTIQELFADETA